MGYLDFKERRGEALDYGREYSNIFSPGYLYIVVSPTFPEFIKIGMTTKSLESRLRTYNSYNPYSDYRFVYTTGLLLNVVELERELIKLLNPSLVANEWFSVDKKQEAINFLKEANMDSIQQESVRVGFINEKSYN